MSNAKSSIYHLIYLIRSLLLATVTIVLLHWPLEAYFYSTSFYSLESSFFLVVRLVLKILAVVAKPPWLRRAGHLASLPKDIAATPSYILPSGATWALIGSGSKTHRHNMLPLQCLTDISSTSRHILRDGEDLQQQSLGQMRLLTECTASFGSWTSSTSRLWMTRKVSQNKFTTGSW